MKKLTLVIALLLVISCCLLCACNKPQQPDDAPIIPTDPTLLNGLENNADLYSVYPMDVAPRDEYQVTINTDPAFIKAGNGSLKYVSTNGTAHSFIQLISRSNLPDLDVTKLKSVSLWVYNATDSQQKLTLSITNISGAPMFSVQQQLEPNQWTQVKYDQLAEFSYKKKSNVAGIAFRFDIEGKATLYVDEIRVELGAEDVPPADFNQVVAGIANIAPTEALTGETFANNVKFIDAVRYARLLYNDLANTSGYEASYAKLQTYEQLLGGFSTLYTPRSDDDVISKWEYGNGLTIAQEVDETYGGVWSIIVDAKSAAEQSFKFNDLDVSAYGEIAMWVYNPTDFELTLQIHGGWNLWSAYATKLTPKEWTMVQFNCSIVEKDTVGSAFIIISNGQVGFSGTFLFTALYGVPANVSAKDVIDTINQLPDKDSITLEHKPTVQQIRTSYEDLSAASKSAVTNYSKLTDAENKIATIEADEFDQKITQVVSVEVTVDNVLERYIAVSDLTNQYKALDDLTYYRVTKWSEIESYNVQIDALKAQLVVELVNSFPNADSAQFPKLLTQVNLAKTLFDQLNETQQSNVDVAKLNSLVAVANNYLLQFDFTVDNSNKVSTVTDFGNSWQGDINYVTDSTYGNVMVCNVTAGHTNAPTQAEFRLRVYNKIYQYEKIYFYVMAPIDNAKLVVYSENWKKHMDISLVKDQWTLVEIDADFATTNNLDGMFFIFTAPNEQALVGQWKATSVYAYFDQAKTDKLLGDFATAMQSVPAKEQVTLADKQAIETARQLYDDLPTYCKGYVKASVVKQLTEAEERIEVLEASTAINGLLTNVNALNQNSTGEQILNVWLQYKNLGKFQSEIDQSVVNAIKNAMDAKAQDVAKAYDDLVQEFYSRYDFPRDKAEFAILYDIVLRDLSDAVFGFVSSDTTTIISTLKKELDSYKTATTGIRPSDVIEDDKLGTTYRYTLTNNVISGWDGCVFKLQANVAAKATKVVFYVYRPQDGSNASLKVALDKPWTEPADLVFSITQDGWTRIEYTVDTDHLDTTRDCYFYLFLNGETASQGGWLVSQLYYQ